MKSHLILINSAPETVTEYYRIHFRPTLKQPEHLERVIESLRSGFMQEGILKAREIEDRPMNETWLLLDEDAIKK
jgi:hypothetical protein